MPPQRISQLRSASLQSVSRQSDAVILIGQIGVGFALLAIWQFCASLNLIDPLISRSPIQVWTAFRDMISDGTLAPALYATVEATLVAFVLASVIGVVCGVGLGLFPKFEALIDPYLTALNCMPRIAFAPVFILYFGIGQSAKVALAFSIVVFTMLVSSRGGIRTVDRDILMMAQTMNSTRWQLFVKILLPSAVPAIFSGLRLGVIYSLLGVVTSEILSSRVGLGQLIAFYAGIFKLEGMYAVVIILALVASILNIGMGMIEKRLLAGRAT